MNTYVQLKDGVAFAYVITEGEVENGILIEGNPDSYLEKAYINGQFVTAEPIYFGKLDLDGETLIQINKTLFSSEVDGMVIDNPEVKIGWKWDGNAFNPAPVVEPVVIYQVSPESIPSAEDPS